MTMRTRTTLLAFVAAAAVLLPAATSGQARRPGRPSASQRTRTISVAQVPVAAIDAVTGLTTEQKTKIQAIQTKLQKDLRELRPQPPAPADPGVRLKVADLQKRASDEILAALTPDQKKKLEEARPVLSLLRRAGIPLAVVASVKLTTEQKERIAVIAREATQKLRAMAPEERRTRGREIAAEVRSKVEALLTAEQKTIVEKARKSGRSGSGGARRSGSRP